MLIASTGRETGKRETTKNNIIMQINSLWLKKFFLREKGNVSTMGDESSNWRRSSSELHKQKHSRAS